MAISSFIFRGGIVLALTFRGGGLPQLLGQECVADSDPKEATCPPSTIANVFERADSPGPELGLKEPREDPLT